MVSENVGSMPRRRVAPMIYRRTRSKEDLLVNYMMD